MELGKGPRKFDTYFESRIGGPVIADRIQYVADTPTYLGRYVLTNVGPSASKLPSVNALAVVGIVDEHDNWVADFPAPTADDPEVIF